MTEWTREARKCLESDVLDLLELDVPLPASTLNLAERLNLNPYESSARLYPILAKLARMGRVERIVMDGLARFSPHPPQAVADGLGDHLKLLAERRRRDLAEPYRPGAPPVERRHEPKPVVDVALPEPERALFTDLPA